MYILTFLFEGSVIFLPSFVRYSFFALRFFLTFVSEDTYPTIEVYVLPVLNFKYFLFT